MGYTVYGDDDVLNHQTTFFQITKQRATISRAASTENIR